jgi:uncharacterized metal-binding protein YceD (DUF177 family)
MTPELSRPVSLSKIGHTGLTFLVRATPEECTALAVRMDLPAIRSLECFFDLVLEGDGVSITAQGKLRAAVTRICVISAEEFEALVDDQFEVRFVPAGAERDDPDPDLPDEIPYQAASIDLGEATAEQLGLALDPYPRMEGAEMSDSGWDEIGSPFAVLRGRLGPDKTRH